MGRRQAGSGTWGGPGWKPPWGSALLAASVLSTCFLLSQAAMKFVPVVADPEFPKEGGDVTLILQGAIQDFISCRWYRGISANTHLVLIHYRAPIDFNLTGPAYTHREQIVPPFCSLHVSPLRTNDSETYLVTMEGPGLLETGRVELEVLGTAPGRRGAGGLSKGAVAGIVLACLAVVAVLAGVLYFRSTQVSR